MLFGANPDPITFPQALFVSSGSCILFIITQPRQKSKIAALITLTDTFYGPTSKNGQIFGQAEPFCPF